MFRCRVQRLAQPGAPGDSNTALPPHGRGRAFTVPGPGDGDRQSLSPRRRTHDRGTGYFVSWAGAPNDGCTHDGIRNHAVFHGVAVVAAS